jgi:hypothetical protein
MQGMVHPPTVGENALGNLKQREETSTEQGKRY